jgi:hypothetical protein
MNPADIVTEHTETTTETRLRTIKREDGSTEQIPYEHTKETVKRIVSHQPGDWRAAMEYLARRDPAKWARQKVDIDHGGKLTIEVKRSGDEFPYPNTTEETAPDTTPDS